MDLPSLQINLLTDPKHKKGRVEEGFDEKEPAPVRFHELDNLSVTNCPCHSVYAKF